MRTIGNILWLAGFWLALAPFGKDLVDVDRIPAGRDVYQRGPEPIG